MKKDNLVNVDITNQRGLRIEKRNRKMRLLSHPLPGAHVTLATDSFPLRKRAYFLRAVCLLTGTLLCEPV